MNISIHPGFCFHFNDRPDDDHLYVVISRTSAPEVVVVNLTTWNPLADQSCLLEAGDHPFVRHKSCIAFDYADVVPTDLLEKKLQNGDITPREPASRELMLKILDGAEKTRRMKIRCSDILRDQGLI